VVAKQPLIVIVGETASGKSALAMGLAKKFNGELVCADSWTVYKGFDIGTAKPSVAEQKQIKHHLLDIADPKEGFSAAIFKRMAMEAIDDIAQRGKLPILVGGTGLYIDSVLFDYGFLPASDPDQRLLLNAMSLDELLAQTEKIGLDITGIDLRNKRRVIRLIENNGVRPTKKSMRANTLIIGVRRPIGELQKRIISRIDVMVDDGFIDEVSRLMKKYGKDIEAMRAPGYRAFADYVEGSISLNDAKKRFMQNDLKLAKKQRTWFKRNKSIQWVDDPLEAVELVTTFLNKYQ
jgi:tRNA dimethylallyltransferase